MYVGGLPLQIDHLHVELAFIPRSREDARFALPASLSGTMRMLPSDLALYSGQSDLACIVGSRPIIEHTDSFVINVASGDDGENLPLEDDLSGFIDLGTRSGPLYRSIFILD
jgi:hypothetical protein